MAATTAQYRSLRLPPLPPVGWCVPKPERCRPAEAYAVSREKHMVHRSIAAIPPLKQEGIDAAIGERASTQTLAWFRGYLGREGFREWYRVVASDEAYRSHVDPGMVTMMCDSACASFEEWFVAFFGPLERAVLCGKKKFDAKNLRHTISIWPNPTIHSGWFVDVPGFRAEAGEEAATALVRRCFGPSVASSVFALVIRIKEMSREVALARMTCQQGWADASKVIDFCNAAKLYATPTM
jgi:hypothetical protein